MTEQQKEIFGRILRAKNQKDRIVIGIELVSTIPEDGRPHFNNKSLEDIEGEVWVPIPSYEGIYEISSFGRVKSFYRAKNGVRQILTGKIDDGGYIMVSLCKNGIGVRTRVHTIMGKCFKKKPKTKLDVHHLNGIKIDNRESNLEYATRSKNIQHAWDTGLNNGSRYVLGTSRYNAVLTEDIVFKIRTLIKEGKQRKDICKQLGISVHNYKNVQRGAWPHVKV